MPVGYFSQVIAGGLLAAITTATPQPQIRNEESLSSPPPSIQPVSAQVQRGKTVEIIVRAVPRNDSSARILIRAHPQHGRVESTPLDATSARFRYTHDGGDATQDEFLVAAQSRNSPVSASVKVSIRIVEPEPVFDAPAKIEWPDQFDLEESVKNIPLSNLGGGVIEGKATADPPWEVVGDGLYRIPAGGSQSLRVVFRPDSFRQFTGMIRYSGQEGQHATQLAARTIYPLKVQPLRLDFSRRGVSAQQTLTLSNASSEVLGVVLVKPEWLVAPESVMIPAGESVEVVLSVGDVVRSARDSLLVVSTGGFEQSVRLVLPAEEPIIRARWSEEGLSDVSAGRSSQAFLIVSNSGGTPAKIEIIASPPFTVADGKTRIVVEPDAEVIVPMVFHPGHPGQVECQVSLVWEGGRLALPVSVKVMPNAANDQIALDPEKSESGAVPMQSEEFVSLPSELPPNSLQHPYTAPDAFTERRDPSLPPPTESIQVVERRRHEAVLEWRPHANAPPGYFLEIRALRMGANGLPEFYWIEYTDAQDLPPANAGSRRALLRNLYAGTRYAFRLSAKNEEGALSLPVDIPIFYTTSATPFRLNPLAVLAALAATLTAVATWQRWRKNKRTEE